MYAPYSPATRLLTTLDLLQSRPSITAEQLAERLEVEPRSVRRYIMMLQQMGVPIEAERGRYGGYRLRPGFKLPPLMFSDDEAVAVTLGLMAAQQSGLAGTIPAVEGALNKIERVLPAPLRAQAQAIQATVALDLAATETPLSKYLLTFSTAAHTQRTLHMRYQSREAEPVWRDFDCYGLVHYERRWYAVGYCHLRGDIRVFRLDRMLAATPGNAAFTRPDDFDCLAFAIARFRDMPDTWLIEVLLEAPLVVVQGMVPPSFAALEETADGTCTLLRAYDRSLDHSARFLASLGVRFQVRGPAELRAALLRLAGELRMIAGA